MHHELQIRSGDSMPDVVDPLASAPGAEPLESVFKRVHRLLRGRYLWAAGIGLVLATIGGIAGYKSAQPLWTCSGMIQIKTDRDVVLSNATATHNAQSPEPTKEPQAGPDLTP